MKRLWWKKCVRLDFHILDLYRAHPSVEHGLRSCDLPIDCTNDLLRWIHGWFDRLWHPRRQVQFNAYIDDLLCRVLHRYGRRPVMSGSFILMSLAGFLCAFGPRAGFGFVPSYIIFTIARFLLACSTRGISVSGFVLGSEIGTRRSMGRLLLIGISFC